MNHYLSASAPNEARRYRIEYVIGGSVVGARDISSRVDTLQHSKRVAARFADRTRRTCTVYVYRYSQPGVCLAAEGQVFAHHAEPIAARENIPRHTVSY